MTGRIRHDNNCAPWTSGAFLVALVLAGPPASAQSVRSLVNGGNDLYREQKYSDAEVNYRKALDRERELVQGHFNLGNALQKQGKFGDAVREYETALSKAEHADTKANAHYNIGNARMKEQQYQDAVKEYIDALKLNPDDEDAKYNLSYALEKLKQKQQQQQKKDKDKDKQNQNKDDKQKQDQKEKPENQKKDQQQKDQQDRQKQSASQQQRQMSRADAQRILDVLKDNEKEVQKKLRARQAVRVRTEKDW